MFDLINKSKTNDTTKNEKDILEHIKKKLQPGSVFLMHDTKEKNIKVIEEFINFAISEKYKIIGIDELFGIEAYE